jgi:hypothetical protein
LEDIGATQAIWDSRFRLQGHPDAVGNGVLPQRAAVQCANVGI